LKGSYFPHPSLFSSFIHGLYLRGRNFYEKSSKLLLQSKQIVTSEPDVVESTVTEEWEFILLACDGIWDVMSNQQVCDFILKRLALNMQPENICEELMDR